MTADIYLYAVPAVDGDIILSDPLVLRSVDSAVTGAGVVNRYKPLGERWIEDDNRLDLDDDEVIVAVVMAFTELELWRN